MKIERKEVDSERGIVQITTLDERWYEVDGEYLPSVTWVNDYYPKGVGFYKWLAQKGWDEAEALKESAGDKGTIVHNAIEQFLQTKKLSIGDKFNNREGEPRETTPEEWKAIESFSDWYNQTRPMILDIEQIVWTENYAGTVDLVCVINDETWLIDFKTSQNIWPTHELQVSAYKKASERKIDRLAILQLGYRRNKSGYKFTEVEDQYETFKHVYQIWKKENPDAKPKQRDYPMELKLHDYKEIKPTSNKKARPSNSVAQTI